MTFARVAPSLWAAGEGYFPRHAGLGKLEMGGCMAQVWLVTSSFRDLGRTIVEGVLEYAMGRKLHYSET